MKEQLFHAAMYLRLSRDDNDIGDVNGKDGSTKTESNSIGSQREIIRSFIREQENIELYDIYVDDGYTGSNFERPEFKRMMCDIEAGKVNCVIVKDLSRFGRDYIEAGRLLQKTFPAFGVRFIAITDHYDSVHADSSESSILLPVKNFINDSYCRDISTKVKSQLEIKRKNGEFIGAFAVYGYLKDPQNKNKLVIDNYAADVVKKIFGWKIEGESALAIAKKLNELGYLPPNAYKKTLGENYQTGFVTGTKASWSSVTVKRILTNEIYIGNLVQGKRTKVNYKVKKIVDKPETEWIKVENTHEPIIFQGDFETVQQLLLSDGRANTSNEKNTPFAGILFCGDCKEQMIRRVNRYQGKSKVYYICSTKNRGQGCSRHSIEERVLLEIVSQNVKEYANAYMVQSKLFEQARNMETNFEVISTYNKEIIRLRGEQEKYHKLRTSVYSDLQQGVLNQQEFERLHNNFDKKVKTLENAIQKQEELIKELFQKGISCGSRLEQLKSKMELDVIDRYTLASLVKRIYVYENKRIVIEYYFADEYQIMLDANAIIKHEKTKEQIIEEKLGRRA